MRRRLCHIRSWLLAALAAACVLAPASAHAEPGPGFASIVQLNATPLLRNGLGTRYRALFEVYDMALYTVRPVRSAEALQSLEGPKLLRFTALRELSSTDLGLAFIRGLTANAAPEKVLRHTASSNQLIGIFSSRSKLQTGDSFGMQFLPGRGTQFLINEEPQGAPFGDAEFFSMVLDIWVGPNPVDLALKAALLGRSPVPVEVRRR